MAARQGFNRLTSGYARTLTKSEINRGYIFISNDKLIKKLGRIECVLNTDNLGNKEIDSSGRVSVGRKITHNIGEKVCQFKLENKILRITY